MRRLERLAEQVGYLPLTTEMMLLAARFWAEARNQGQPTASDPSLDAILAAQASVAEGEDRNTVVVATTNPRHLSRFVDARGWREIEP